MQIHVRSHNQNYFFAYYACVMLSKYEYKPDIGYARRSKKPSFRANKSIKVRLVIHLFENNRVWSYLRSQLFLIEKKRQLNTFFAILPLD